MITDVKLYTPDENHMMLVVTEDINSVITDTKYLIEPEGTMELSDEEIIGDPQIFESTVFAAVENARLWLDPNNTVFPPANEAWYNQLYAQVNYKVQNILA